jgi:hypothetical protein
MEGRLIVTLPDYGGACLDILQRQGRYRGPLAQVLPYPGPWSSDKMWLVTMFLFKA